MLFSQNPWNGPETGDTRTAEVLKNFPDFKGKIKVIRGSWKNQVEQRNFGLALSREAGFRYSMILDADEIYEPGDLFGMMRYAVTKPAVECWHMQWHTYWKSPDYRIDPVEAYHPSLFILNDTAGHFAESRNFVSYAHDIIPPGVGMCHHMSYARSDADMQRKINSFGHAADVRQEWFENVWKGWDTNHDLSNLHPVNPPLYRRAVPTKQEDLPPMVRPRWGKI